MVTKYCHMYEYAVRYLDEFRKAINLIGKHERINYDEENSIAYIHANCNIAYVNRMFQ